MKNSSRMLNCTKLRQDSGERVKRAVFGREMSLEEIKRSGLKLLVFLKEYCDSNHIGFYLSNGTLLGAVKYKGYIPWDDDVDVFVPRSDYDRFIREFQDTEQIRLFSEERQSNYCFPFAKLCDMNTLKIESSSLAQTEMGVCIDIFPLDDYSNLKVIANIESTLAHIRVALLSLSQMEEYRTDYPLKRVIYKFARAVGMEKLKWKTNQKRTFGRCRYVGNRVWPIYGAKEVLPAEVFERRSFMEFEGEKFPIPEGYHIYLSSLYGDYRKDPPLDQQVTHHSFKAYWRQ